MTLELIACQVVINELNAINREFPDKVEEFSGSKYAKAWIARGHKRSDAKETEAKDHEDGTKMYMPKSIFFENKYFF